MTQLISNFFSDIGNLPGVGSIGGLIGGGQASPPILTQLPDTLKAFQNKYNNATINQYIATLPPNVTNSLISLDQQRVSRGQMPYTKKQFIQAGETARTGVPYTTPPSRKITNVFGNAMSDLRTLTASIPKIPYELYHEARDLPNLPNQIAAAKSPSDVLQLPGFNLIPGSYTLSNLLRGKQGIQEALTHPLFTGLDVLPAKEIPLGKELTVGSALAQSRVGRAAAAGKAAFSRTRPGQFLEQLWGPQSRQLAHLENNYSGQLREILNPDSKVITDQMIAGDPIASGVRAASLLNRKYPSIYGDQLRTLTQKMELGDLGDLTDLEKGYVKDYQQILDGYAKHGIENGYLTQVDGEIYSTSEARRLIRDQQDLQKAKAQDAELQNEASAKRLARAQERFDRRQRATAPARFQPLIEKDLEKGLKILYGTPENIDQITKLIAQGNYSAIPGFDQQEVLNLATGIKNRWMKMRDAGLEPIFVHRISRPQVAGILYPHVLETIRTPSALRARTLDATPYVQDATAGLTHQGLEFLSRDASEAFADELLKPVSEGGLFAKTLGELRNEYAPIAERRAQRSGDTVALELDNLIKKNWETFDPTSILPWAKGKNNRFTLANETGQTWIPKPIAKNIRAMHEPSRGGLKAAVDPVMGVFRTAVLPLSVRWHVNNIFGGGLMAAAEDPKILFNLGRARELINTGKVTGKNGEIQMSRNMALALGSSSRPHLEAQFAAGTQLGNIMRTINAERIAGNAEMFQKMGSKLVQKSYDFNAHMDDMYRAAAYLTGYERALTKSGGKASIQETQAAGEALARKVLQTWTDLTPLERSIMRYVFPFYGFSQHIVRYALRYPMDHPFRVAVMGSLARTEMNDLGTALPEKFLNSFFLGKPDKNGNVKSIQLGGMNPFSDVADYFTLTGMLGKANPLFQVVAEQFGIDPQTGAPELYPDLYFDAKTGRLAARSKNPVQSLIAHTIPQSQVLLGLTHASQDFKDLMARDPAAAQRQIRSQLGFPILFRQINIPQEEAKTEIARSEAAQEALRTALKTGKDQEANRFKTLQPLLAQIRQLQANGALQQYTPTQSGPSPLEVAQQAIIANNTPYNPLNR